MNTHPSRTSARGFTMIEILIVIAVIVILAAIVIAIAVGVTSGAKEKATRATFDRLDGAMSLFLKDHPEPTDANWLPALQAFAPSAQLIRDQVKTVNGNQVVLDGWGTPIHYFPARSAPRNLPVGSFQSYARDLVPSSDDIYSNGAAPAQ